MPNGNAMASATPPLKVNATKKRCLQARARRDKNSLNACVSGKVDYAQLNAGLNAKFGRMNLWKQLGDLR